MAIGRMGGADAGCEYHILIQCDIEWAGNSTLVNTHTHTHQQCAQHAYTAGIVLNFRGRYNFS